MQFDGPRTDGATAGQRHLGLMFARQQRRQNLEAGPHFSHHVIGSEHRGDLARLQLHDVALAQPRRHGDLDGDTEAHQQLGHGAHIRQARHIGQDQGFGGQQRRRHQL